MLYMHLFCLLKFIQFHLLFKVVALICCNFFFHKYGISEPYVNQWDYHIYGTQIYCVSCQSIKKDMKKYQMMFEQEDRSTRSKASKV